MAMTAGVSAVSGRTSWACQIFSNRVRTLICPLPLPMYTMALANRRYCRLVRAESMIARPDLYTTTGVSMPLLTRQTTVLGLAITAVLAASQAGAQSTPGELPEVVVTARQRAERIEDVPATVRAFTDADIQSAGIQRPTDFIELTPNVSQVQTAEAGDMQVVIRGINTGRDAETNFALVVDGVLQTNPNALNQELNGITQIEVLKGPQGAIYGRNALAGAIILSTRKPSDEPEFEVGAGYRQRQQLQGQPLLQRPARRHAAGQPLPLYAQHRRPVEQHAARLRRLRGLLRGVRRHRAADFRRRRRHLRRQGQGLDGRVGRHQLQRGRLVLRSGDDLRRPALRRGPERPRLLLHEQHHSRRTSRTT